jgi:hypothetical protein
MAHIIHNIGVAGQIGDYSDAVEAAPNLRWPMTSGARRGHDELHDPRRPPPDLPLSRRKGTRYARFFQEADLPNREFTQVRADPSIHSGRNQDEANLMVQ